MTYADLYLMNLNVEVGTGRAIDMVVAFGLHLPRLPLCRIWCECISYIHIVDEQLAEGAHPSILVYRGLRLGWKKIVTYMVLKMHQSIEFNPVTYCQYCR